MIGIRRNYWVHATVFSWQRRVTEQRTPKTQVEEKRGTVSFNFQPQMARRSVSLPGRPSKFSLSERKRSLPLPQRKQVHWSSDLEEVIYFAPDRSTLLDDGLVIRPYDRRVKLLRSQSTKTLSKSKRPRPLRATHSLARSINDANSTLIRSGMNILSQQLDRFRSRSENLEIFDHQSNNRWKELLAHYQKRMRDRLEEQEEEWVWGLWLAWITCVRWKRA